MKLVFGLDVVRHGDRAPVIHMPKFSDAWQEDEIGKLTELGLENSRKLGERMKKHYIETHNLLPEHYGKDLMVVRSTNYDRTINTAKQILRGMYPEHFDQIEIVTQPKDKDVLLLPYHQAMLQLRMKYFYYQMSEEEHALLRTLMGKMEQIMGHKLSDIDLLNAADVLNVNKIHKIKLHPELTSHEAEDILTLAHKIWLRRFAPHETQHVVSANLLTHIREVIEQTTLQDKPRYILYVAHDYNLIALLMLLSQEITKIPPYNAFVRFEVLQDKGLELVVRVSYDGNPIKIGGQELNTVSRFLSATKLKGKE
jgi:acid phosphatase